ncbi:MAG: type III-A CRISPR-associated RAMP protein Csm5 [Deltaproteobacteria bacterium]|nr:type III-A CRISPR-associated RAMP protein Csm5 [Deltaproteobacteria bacterium]
MEKQTANGRIQCRLQVVTPVHVGCDEIYEPTGFVVHEGKERLIVFDQTNFILALNEDDRERFSAICRKGTTESIIDVYRFMQNRHAEGRTVNLCRGFSDEYRRVLKLSPRNARTQLNRFEIKRTAFCPPDNRPYIPGSAIKGALRTAYLNVLARRGPVHQLDPPHGKGRRPDRDDRHKVLESKLLSLDKVQPKQRISQDPFRLVKVSDFMPVGEAGTKIMYAVNWKKGPSGHQGRGPYQMVEIVMPGACFLGEIRVDVPQTEDAVTMVLNLEGTVKGCRSFFEKEHEREAAELRGMGCKTPDLKICDGAFPFRVGFHSGAECVTIEGYREIFIKGRKSGRPLDHATTIWLASEYDKPKRPDSLVPFGWTAIEPLGPEALKELAEQESVYKKDRNRALRQAADAARARLEKETAETNRLERLKAEAEAQRAAEEKRKADLEAMSPEERAIAELESADVVENRAVEIYREMQQYAEPYKTKAAQALKAYWQAKGKWTGKQSNKQKEKIRNIRAILND